VSIVASGSATLVGSGPPVAATHAAPSRADSGVPRLDCTLRLVGPAAARRYWGGQPRVVPGRAGSRAPRAGAER
jgi:hypothetical protein